MAHLSVKVKSSLLMLLAFCPIFLTPTGTLAQLELEEIEGIRDRDHGELPSDVVMDQNDDSESLNDDDE